MNTQYTTPANGHSRCGLRQQGYYISLKGPSQRACSKAPTVAVYSLFWNSRVFNGCCRLVEQVLLSCIHAQKASLSYVQPSDATTASCAKSCSHIDTTVNCLYLDGRSLSQGSSATKVMAKPW